MSVTGIAGPDGGSEEKPVGLVHFACARRDNPTQHVRMLFGQRAPHAQLLARAASRPKARAYAEHRSSCRQARAPRPPPGAGATACGLARWFASTAGGGSADRASGLSIAIGPSIASISAACSAVPVRETETRRSVPPSDSTQTMR